MRPLKVNKQTHDHQQSVADILANNFSWGLALSATIYGSLLVDIVLTTCGGTPNPG